MNLVLADLDLYNVTAEILECRHPGLALHYVQRPAASLALDARTRAERLGAEWVVHGIGAGHMGLEVRQSVAQSLQIPEVGVRHNVNVLGRPQLAVRENRDATNQDEIDFMRDEHTDEVGKLECVIHCAWRAPVRAGPPPGAIAQGPAGSSQTESC